MTSVLPSLTEQAPPLRTAGAPLGFQRILVPTDFSHPSLKAIDYAIALAAPVGGEVQLIHALEPSGDPANYMNYDAGRPLAPSPEDARRCREELQRIADERRGASITCRTSVGNPAAEIVESAKELSADLIVISTHGRTGLKHLLLGSVAERVLRLAPCSVLVLRRHEREYFPLPKQADPDAEPRRILAPTDFSPRSLASLRLAGKFAAAFGGKITVMHCLRRLNALFDDELGIDSAALEASARLAAEKALCDSTPPEVAEGIVVRTGHPLAEIPKAAEAGAFDLIICASHSFTPVHHMLLGSTAEGIVRHASCPVLVVKTPRGGEHSAA